jgi:hypothetical protein
MPKKKKAHKGKKNGAPKKRQTEQPKPSTAEKAPVAAGAPKYCSEFGY